MQPKWIDLTDRCWGKDDSSCLSSWVNGDLFHEKGNAEEEVSSWGIWSIVLASTVWDICCIFQCRFGIRSQMCDNGAQRTGWHDSVDLGVMRLERSMKNPSMGRREGIWAPGHSKVWMPGSKAESRKGDWTEASSDIEVKPRESGFWKPVKGVFQEGESHCFQCCP